MKITQLMKLADIPDHAVHVELTEYTQNCEPRGELMESILDTLLTMHEFLKNCPDAGETQQYLVIATALGQIETYVRG